jgi:phosphatidylinositol-3-phosphatase
MRTSLLLLACCWLVGCGGGTTGAQPTQQQPSRVAVLVLENQEAPDVVGSPEAPYLTSLAHQYALVSGGHGLGHPSLPNYIGLVAGRTAGITSDCPPSSCPVDGPSLVDQLEARGIPWRAYMESMPRPCFHYSGDELGRYAQRHNPFAYLTRVSGRPDRCRKVVPLTSLRTDLRRGLARFTWITPNLCHDMHDCGVSEGDAWLRHTVPPLLDALGPRGLLVITFDEGTTDQGCCDGADGGRIASVLAGNAVRRGATSNRSVDHYSTLATIEAVLNLPRLGQAKSAPPLTALLK